MRWLLEPYTDPATYRVVGYLLIGLPLGIFEYVVVVTGVSVGLGLAVTLLGLPVLLATLLLTSALASFERDLAASMLGAAMPRHFTRRDEAGFGWARLKARLIDRRTWSELAYVLLLRLPLGIGGFTMVVTVFALQVGLVVQPVLVAVGAPTQFGNWTIDTYVESLVFIPMSVLFLLVGPRLVLGWADINRRIVTGVLGWLDAADIKRAVVSVLARTGSADAFTVFDDAELLLGKGPFLTPTKLEAALVVLESTGRITGRPSDDRTVYSLATIAAAP